MLFLTGQYFHAFDAKSRLTIPAKLREEFRRFREGHEFIAVSAFDKVLHLYTPRVYEKVAPHFPASLHTKKEVRDYERLRYALAERLEVDRLGRILISENTRQQCDLSREVAIVGVRDHIEIWDRDRWQAFVADGLEKHDELAERAMAIARRETVAEVADLSDEEPPEGAGDT